MKFTAPGRTISASVEGITPFGLWLLFGNKEYFLGFEDFPYFKNQSVKAVQNVRVLHDVHLHWPELDVDLEIDNLENPDRYPLICRSKKREAVVHGTKKGSSLKSRA